MKKLSPEKIKNVTVFLAIAMSFVLYSNLIYLKAGITWSETLIGWDSTRYIGLAKLILEDSTFFRLYAPFLFPSLLALGLLVSPENYNWAILWYRIVETLTISSIIYITSNNLKRIIKSTWLNVIFIFLLICNFRNFILSMYIPFTLAFLFSNLMLTISEKILRKQDEGKKLYIVSGVLTVLIIVSDNLYHVLLALIALTMYLIINRKSVDKVKYLILSVEIILIILFMYLLLSRIFIAYTVALAQIAEPIKYYLPEYFQSLIFKEPFDKCDYLFRKIIENFVQASHYVVLARPASLYSAISFSYFNEIDFLLLLLLDIIFFIELFHLRSEAKENIILNYYFAILILILFNIVLLTVTHSNYFVTYLFRFSGIYDSRAFFFILVLLLLDKYNINLHLSINLRKRIKNYKIRLLLLVASVAIVEPIVTSLHLSLNIVQKVYVYESDVGFIKDTIIPITRGGNIILVTTFSSYSYPGFLNKIEGLLWYFGGSNIVIFPITDLKDICFINHTLYNLSNNFTFSDPTLNLLQYYYAYVYFEKMKNISCFPLTLVITESIYKNKYDNFLTNYSDHVNSTTCNERYCAILVHSAVICDRSDISVRVKP